MTTEDVGELDASEVIGIGIAIAFMDTEAGVLLGFPIGFCNIDVRPQVDEKRYVTDGGNWRH